MYLCQDYWRISRGDDLLSLLGTLCASVAKDIIGSLRENRAQDFDLKLMPWKHAKEILVPWRSRVPPKTAELSEFETKLSIVAWPKALCQCL